MKTEYDIVTTEEVSSAERSPVRSPHTEHGRGSSSLPTIKNRLGLVAAIALFASAALVLGSMAFLSFIWFSGPNNSVWSRVITKDWTTRVVTFISIGIRWAIGTQTASCLAMLAALSLEKYYVPHPDVAAVSMMRIGGSGLIGTIRDLLFPLVVRGPRQVVSLWTIVASIIALLLTSTSLQFTSTLLLSDLAVRPIPELPQNNSIPIDHRWVTTPQAPCYSSMCRYYGTWGVQYFDSGYVYNLSSTDIAWGGRRPSAYPAFAELHRADTVIHRDNVSDTGSSLRALLPIQSQASRQSLRSYSGKAVVMDSRVTCIQPTISNATWDGEAIFGNITASMVLEHVNPTVGSNEFRCPSLTFQDYALCELQSNGIVKVYEGQSFAGGLLSEMRNSQTNNSGAAYVITSSLKQSGSEWLPVNLTAICNMPEDSGQGCYSSGDLFVTLCYTASDVAHRAVIAYSGSNRTEPVPKLTKQLDSQKDVYDFSPVIRQMTPGPAEDRGILNLSLREGEEWKQLYSNLNDTDGPAPIYDNSSSWQPLPYLVSTLHFRRQSGTIGNYALLLKESENRGFDIDLADGRAAPPWMTHLFNAFLPHGGAAKALQSLLHIVATNAYYDPDHFELYDKFVNVTTTRFGDHLTPAATYFIPLGKYSLTTRVPPFFTAVCIILFIHHLLVASIFYRFMRETKYSRLGDPWQAVAHVVLGEESSQVLETSGSMTADRTAAHKVMKRAGITKVCVGIKEDEEGVVVLTRAKSR